MSKFCINKKRLLAVLMTVIMLLSLAACASTGESGNTTTPAGGNGDTNSGSGNVDAGDSSGDSGNSNDPSGDGTQEAHTIEQFVQEFYEMEWGDKSEHVKGSLPQQVWDWYEREHGLTYETALANYKEHQANLKVLNERDFGANYQFTFTIDKIDPLPPDITLEEIANALAELYPGIDPSKVTDCKVLTVTATQFGDDDSLTGTTGLDVVQYDGRWYCVVYTRNDFGVFANFSSRGAAG